MRAERVGSQPHVMEPSAERRLGLATILIAIVVNQLPFFAARATNVSSKQEFEALVRKARSPITSARRRSAARCRPKDSRGCSRKRVSTR
jgi:hypothetical protein